MDTYDKANLKTGDGDESDKKSAVPLSNKRGRARKKAKLDDESKGDITLCEADTTTVDDEPKRKVPRDRKALTASVPVPVIEVGFYRGDMVRVI